MKVLENTFAIFKHSIGTYMLGLMSDLTRRHFIQESQSSISFTIPSAVLFTLAFVAATWH